MPVNQNTQTTKITKIIQTISLPPSKWSLRLVLVCLVAVSVSLPMAMISLAKVGIFVFSLLYFFYNLKNPHYRKSYFISNDIKNLWTPFSVLLIVVAFAISLLWTNADVSVVSLSFIKHTRLLEILVLLMLIHTEREARIAILFFAIGQVIYLLSSWLMVIGIHVPWQRFHDVNRGNNYVVFSTYLDQSIIFATTAAVYWNLRNEKLWSIGIAGILAIAALLNVLLLLSGRTAYFIAASILTLAVMWSIPRKFRLASLGVLLVTPILFFGALYFSSTRFHEGTDRIVNDMQKYTTQGNVESSSGWRLHAWRRSIEAISEKPIMGYGIGSWTNTVKQLDGSAATAHFGQNPASNPHQEYLLWGVELGIGGIVLLLTFLVSLLHDALQFKTNIGRTLISVTTAMAIACLFNSALYDGLIGDYFCVVLGLVFALGVRNLHSSPNSAANANASNGVPTN